MYEVWLRTGWDSDEFLIQSSRANDLKLDSPIVTEDVAATNSFTFNIYPTNPGYDELQYMVSFVRVYNVLQKHTEFEGRVLQSDTVIDTDGSIYKEVTCADMDDFLHDSVPGFVEFSGKRRSDIVNALLQQHNSEIDSYKTIKPGKLDFGSDGQLAYCYTDDSADTYTNLTSLVMDGFELRVRHESDGLYLDTQKSFGEQGKQIVQIQRSILSLNRTFDPTSMGTVVKPVGKAADPPETDTDDNTDKGTARLTVAATNNGSPFVRNEDLIKQYGIIIKPKAHDDTDNATTLLSQGKSDLSSVATITDQLQVTTADLSVVDGKVDELVCGNQYRILAPQAGLSNDYRRISQYAIYLNDPASNTITFGDRVLGQEAYNQSLQVEMQSQLQKLRGQLSSALKRANNAANQVFASMASVSLTASKSGDKQISYSTTLSGDNSGTVRVEVSSDGGGTWSTAGGSPMAVTAYGTYQLRAKAVYGNYSTKYSGTVSVQLAAPASTGIGDANGAIIDVSEFQGSINWPSVVAGGLSLATIRVQHGYTYADKTYTTNIPNAIAAGANYAVYAYFAGLDSDDAKDEAKSFVSRAKGAIGSNRSPRFWMVDVEEISVTSGTMRDAVGAYMDQLNSLGVPDSQIVLYIANQLYDTFNLDVGRAAGIWIPSYGANDGTVGGSSKPSHPYDLWQYTSKGRVSGITGDVDMSTNPSARMKTLINNK